MKDHVNPLQLIDALEALDNALRLPLARHWAYPHAKEFDLTLALAVREMRKALGMEFCLYARNGEPLSEEETSRILGFNRYEWEQEDAENWNRATN